MQRTRKTRSIMAALLGSGLLVLGACAGDDGAKGDPGETGQPGLKGDPGEPGEAGNNGASCTVVDNTDGSRTVSCSDGTSATISNGAPGAKGDAGDAGTSCTATILMARRPSPAPTAPA
jgi:hypothetical protein